MEALSFTPNQLEQEQEQEQYTFYESFDEYIAAVRGKEVYDKISGPVLTNIPTYSVEQLLLDAVNFFASKGVQEITTILKKFNIKDHIENGLKRYVADSKRINSALRKKLKMGKNSEWLSEEFHQGNRAVSEPRMIYWFDDIHSYYKSKRTNEVNTQTYNLLDAFKKIAPSSEPFRVYRCYQKLQDGWPIMSSDREIYPFIHIDTFLSTSILLRVCDFWCVPGPINDDNPTHINQLFRPDGVYGNNTIICIEIPVGTRGISVVHYSQVYNALGSDYSEFEYLLPPGGYLKHTGRYMEHVSKNREEYDAFLQSQGETTSFWDQPKRRTVTHKTNKDYPEDTLPKTMTIHIYEYIGTAIPDEHTVQSPTHRTDRRGSRVSQQYRPNDNGAGIGSFLPPPATLPPPAQSPSQPPPPPSPPAIVYKMGDRVQVRDNDTPSGIWWNGRVTSIEPLKVLADGHHYAHHWDHKRPMPPASQPPATLPPPAPASQPPAPASQPPPPPSPPSPPAIVYKRGDRVQVRNNDTPSGIWWNGTVTSTEPLKVLCDGFETSHTWDHKRLMPPSVTSRLIESARKTYALVESTVSNASRRAASSVRIGGKRKKGRKQTKKRRKSLTITHMKIGKRLPQKKTLRKN